LYLIGTLSAVSRNASSHVQRTQTEDDPNYLCKSYDCLSLTHTHHYIQDKLNDIFITTCWIDI